MAAASYKREFDYHEFVCGWGAAFINITVTFPINKVMFRQMLHGVHTNIAVQQLKHEGLRYLYRGLLPPLIQKTISVSIMFGTYKEYSQIISQNFPTVPTSVCLGAAAILAGSTEAILTPLERVQTLLQDKHYHNRFRNTHHAFMELRKFGMKEYFRGLTPILIRNGPSNVLFFSLRGKIKETLPESKTWWGHLVEDFISGAVIGAFISTLFYPVNVVKTKMQVCCGTPFLSIKEACILTYEERGRSLKRMFYGLHVNYTRALISWGIINASYELLKKLLKPSGS